MTELIRRANAATLSVVDGVVLFWLVLWAAVGGWVGYSLWELSAVGDTLVQSGRTIDGAGQALQRIGDIPLIGGWPAEIGDQVRVTAAEIVERGRETSAYGRRLGVLLAVTVCLAPVLVPYLPARVVRRREMTAVRRLLRDPARHRILDAYLAHRAVDTLPLRRLEQLSADPWQDLADGDLRSLADAELTRLGLRRTTDAGAPS